MTALRFLVTAALVLLPVLAHAGQWGVHLASYRLESNVHGGWIELEAAYPDLLRGLSPQKTVVNIPGKGPFVRLMAGPISSKAKAEALRQQFVRRGKYAEVMALPGAARLSMEPPLPAEELPLCSDLEDLRVRIRPVDTHDLIDMDANPVQVVAPERDTRLPRDLASRAYLHRSDPQTMARRERSLADKIQEQLPQPATVSLHSDSLTRNSDPGDPPDLTPGGKQFSPEFAGVAIGNDSISLTPGLCRIGEQVAPYAGIGVSF